MEAGKQVACLLSSDCLTLALARGLSCKGKWAGGGGEVTFKIFIEFFLLGIILCCWGSSVSPKHKTPSLVEREWARGHSDRGWTW